MNFNQGWLKRAKIMRRFLSLSGLLYSIMFAEQSIGQTINTEQQPKAEYLFEIKPITCVVLQQGDDCRLLAQFHWRLSQVMDVCIWQDLEPLYCWQKQQQAIARFSVAIKPETIFYLRDNQGMILAQQKIQINTMQSPQYRRRLHSDWSLF